MIEAGEKYVHGSVAEKLEYNVYEENQVLKAKKKQKQNNKAKLKMVFNVLFIFAMAFTLILRYAIITELNYEIDNMNKQYNEIRNENSRLKFAVEKEMNLANIEEIAKDKLGMHKPDKNQIVYVSVPKNDFSVASESYESMQNEKGVLAGFLNRLGSFVNLIY